MRWFILAWIAALPLGCAKGTPAPSAPAKPAPSDAAFAGDSPENTLAWLVAQWAALQQSGDKDAGEKFKALAESMRGRPVNWPGKLGQPNPDRTCGLLAYTLDAEPPGPRSAEAREWHYAMVCRPFDPAARVADDAPFVRKPEVGFSMPADWQRPAAGAEVRLAGTIAAVQLHRRLWVTGYGLQDRVVHTEIGITLHIADGTLSPGP